jgi:hypothetical protein
MLGVALSASLLCICSAPALAGSGAGPARWAITSVAGPTYFKPASSDDEYLLTATNVGGEPTSGPVTITDTLPGEAEATKVVGSTTIEEGIYGDAFTKKPLSCTSPAPVVKCEYSGTVDPGDSLTFVVRVNVKAKEGNIVNAATVSGGGVGVGSVSTSEPTTKPTPVTEAPVPFGVASFFAATSSSQAGAYPNFTTSFTTNWSELHNKVPLPAASPHDIGVDLPPGLTGNALAVSTGDPNHPRCSIDEVRREVCPQQDAVGIATARSQGSNVFTQLVYSVTPYPNEPAAFAFTIARGIATARLDTSVVLNSNGEYAVHVTVPDVNESEALLASSVTLWGAPAFHNRPGPDTSTERAQAGEEGARECELKQLCKTFGGAAAQAALEKPFMRNPTSCVGLPPVELAMDSWQAPGAFLAAEPSPFPTGSECTLISPSFKPALEVAPDSSTEIAPHTFQAGAPSGYGVKLEVPQNESAQSLATPDLANSTVTLPVGTVASPSAANGLEACSDAQFDPSSVEEAHCPLASEVGKVKVKTPLLKEELTGQLFLGEPLCPQPHPVPGAPCGPSESADGKMLRLFLQAQLQESSQQPGAPTDVRIKLVGSTHVNQQTGQLTTVFEENPQQPFEKLTLHIDGGANAPLANPSACGTATTTSRLVPWSSTPEAPFTAEPSSSFQVGGCVSRFAPSFAAGMTESVQAGAYGTFSTIISRGDSDQQLGGVTVTTPPGLLGSVAQIPLCAEPQAAEGACGPESEIGTVTTAAGPGPEPFWITGGRVYLTGPYKGAPFGLSIVVPTVAGPFNLGEEHLRAAIRVDPNTGALTVVSDPLPTIKDGVPFQVKAIEVNIDRRHFTFNATNCNGMSVGAAIVSTQGAVATPSYPYQATGCAGLPFHPELTAEAGGQGSKANGTSFTVKVKSSAGQANIGKTFLQLPGALPSRLSTIQKACVAATFEANPASCPEGSVIGTAIAHTPLLRVPLEGPAYLVSHGNAAFPDVEFVLQGENVTLILDGKTDIKNGITYSRFETVPDAPVETFETVLPAGPHSALTANVPESEHFSLCDTQLVMPTEITGQNGAVIKQTTHIAVTGCPPGAGVTITSAKVSANALLVTFKTAGAGTVWVSGFGLHKAHKAETVGTHQIRVTFTKLGMRKHEHHQKTTVRVKLVVGKQAVTRAMTARL